MIVGVNKYRLESEDQIDVLMIDNNEVRTKQINKLNEVNSDLELQVFPLCSIPLSSSTHIISALSITCVLNL